MKRTNKFKYNKENTLSRLFAQNRRRNPRHDEDEEEDGRRESHGGAGAAAMGLGSCRFRTSWTRFISFRNSSRSSRAR